MINEGQVILDVGSRIVVDIVADDDHHYHHSYEVS